MNEKVPTTEASLPAPAPTPRSARSTRPTFGARAFRALVLLSAAATLFTLLPGSRLDVRQSFISTPLPLRTAAADPADTWRDDVWPLRDPTPWDISTDFPFARKLEYDVSEGTWLRLDVHPRTGDVVFDMLGDLYCLPADAYSASALTVGASPTRARPILVGVPHDSDPRFSPDGSKLVFRSDAELGIENIWVAEWKGCEAMDVRPRDEKDTELASALSVKEAEEDMLARGVKEDAARKRFRLLREGRLGARRVTNETYRWVSDARFHPSGSKLIATKWYTSSRSLGAGEGWEYDIPSLDDDVRVTSGSGKRLVGRTLPSGWSAEQYGDQQIGPEQFIWNGEDGLIFSKNIIDESAFSYSKDVHTGIYAIFARNLTTGKTETLVSSFPGGASRPELSRDGRTLAFVRRVRDKETLVLKDLVTGTIHHVWDGLTYDLSTVSAPMGTYPSFAFTPSDDAVLIWAAGRIWNVPLSRTRCGERIAGAAPSALHFTAHIEKRLANTRYASTELVALETAPTQRVHAFTDLRADASGERVVFQAAGVTYVQRVAAPGAKPAGAEKVPVLHSGAAYYSPTFVSGRADLVLHARWSNLNFTTFEVADVRTGRAYELAGLPQGRYHSPAVCECSGNRRMLAFVKTAGDLLTGDVVATAYPGLYIAHFELPEEKSASWTSSIQLKDVRFIPSQVDVDAVSQLRFLDKNAKLLVQQPQRALVIDLGKGSNTFGEYEVQDLAKGEMTTELAVAPHGYGKNLHAAHVAVVDFKHVYIAPGHGKGSKPVWSKPGNATRGLARVSVDGGHGVTWSADGKKVFWFLGPYLHSLEVSKLRQCSSAIHKDSSNFGIGCTKNLLEYQEVVVEHSTDVERLKGDAFAVARAAGIDDVAGPAILVITNATVLTMETGSPRGDLIHNALLVVRDGVIQLVMGAPAVMPQGALILNAMGGMIIPGFIDVHAHWNGFASRYPARSWELETFLAYGVTTLHNPSSDNVLGYVERSRVESGLMVGPRIFHTGDVVYGAGEGGLHEEIVDMDEARAALTRIKVEGGPASFSYKNYNLPSRAARQRLLLTAQNLSMICVPEGGMNFDWDLTYIADGMTTIEHAIPIPVLYDDVLTFYALSGTGSTPTHIVNYGGAWGEQYVWANEDVPNDPKLRHFTRHDILEALSESTARPPNSYALFNTSASTAKMVKQGLRAHIGAHGEPPYGLNYHAEMFFTQQGGLTNYETIRAATSDAAATLGLNTAIGSIAAGKLADFLIYPPGVDLLEGDIQQTRNIKYVVRGGRVFNAATMEEFWPVKGRRYAMPLINAD